MHRQPIAGCKPPQQGRVRGLGVSDALALELGPMQLPWLIDELDEVRGPLEEELLRQRATRDDGLNATEYELRLLRLIRARLPGDAADGPVVFVGPEWNGREARPRCGSQRRARAQ